MKTKMLKIIGIVVAVIVVLLLTSPYIFKAKIAAAVREQIAKDLQANVSFTDINISLFRNFPKVSIGLENITVSCVGEFQDDTVFLAKQVDMACNMKSIISGHGIQVNGIRFDEPRLHAVVHANGHANWNILNTDKNKKADGLPDALHWALQRYTIHKGELDYSNDGKNMHIMVQNLEQEATGNMGTEQYDLKTKTTADAVNLQSGGSFPYTAGAKTNINVTFHVDSKTHNFQFNTDQVVLNGLKLHTEGSFQWINDSSYNMNIRYKVPSTDFKNLLSLLPPVYKLNDESVQATGNANFNGYIKGRYDATHTPAFHSNLYVMNGYLKYPDLPLAVEHINLGIQISNPDGQSDHLVINISDAHAEINKDTLGMHLSLKNLKTKPFIDFALKGRLDLANLARCIKIDTSVRMAGSLLADIYAKGNIPGKEKKKKEKFQSGGDLQLTNFSLVTSEHAKPFSIDQLHMVFAPDHIQVKELNGLLGTSQINAAGSLTNTYDYLLRNMPLQADWDLKTEEINLRDLPVAVPANIHFAVKAEAEKLHFDNLDLQHVACQILISEETVHLLYAKANGLDGDIMFEGTYSTQESVDHPQITYTYDAKGVDIQKTFLAFNSIRRIIPVAKFMSGNVDAHMTLSGRMNSDMTTDLASLQGEGTVLLLKGIIKDFGPMDKLAKSLDVARLKDIPLENVKAGFSYKNGSVTVPPFFVAAKDMEFDISGIHGFDQTLDYDISLKLPREDLGKKGNRFVKSVVMKAAEKGIPVKIKDAVRMDVKMAGTINSPEVKTDMDAVVSYAETDLKKQVDEFVNAKLDSAKQELHPQKHRKSLFVQASYKPRNVSKHKPGNHSVHKKTMHSKAVKKKKKKPGRNYTAESKKSRATAGR